MTAPTVARSHIETEAYETFEVNGTPCGELHALRTTSSGTGALFAGLWRHPAGQLDYVFPADETFHMLEGRVRIELRDGPTVELVPGDIVSFAKGDVSTWTILEPMKKFFVISG